MAKENSLINEFPYCFPVQKSLRSSVNCGISFICSATPIQSETLEIGSEGNEGDLSLALSYTAIVLKATIAEAAFRFVNGRWHFRDTQKFFLTVNEFFSSKFKKKENLPPSNHLVSNPGPLFLDIPLKPLHCQVDPPNLPKI